jgi:hypothetical protein
MFFQQIALITILLFIFNTLLFGAILWISWNYGVTALSPNIPTISLFEAILIKMAFASLIGKGIKFSVNDT